MTELLLLILLISLFFIAEGFFSCAEVSFLSANRPRLYRKAKEKVPGAALAKSLLSYPELLFSTTVVGTTLSMNFSTTIVTLYIIHKYGSDKEWVTLLILTPFILIFAEFIPKMLGRTHADHLVLKLGQPLKIFSFILYPLTKTFSIYAQLLKHLVGESPEKGFFLSREEIKAAIPASRGSDITPGERQLVERILEFGKKTAKEMLRPLIDVVAVEETETVADAIKLLAESGHSRVPVYQNRVDRIVGVLQGYTCLHAKDFTMPVRELMQPPFFIPESKPLDELLLELRTHPIAIAVNEFGGAEGIVTLEDVIEEIVGEIEDEYDEPPKLYHRIGESSYIVSARMEVDEVRSLLKIPIPEDDDYQTLAGFLLKRMQKIPKKWDSTIIDNVEYVIQSATDHSIEEVYIIIHKTPLL